MMFATDTSGRDSATPASVSGDYVDFRFLSTTTAETRTIITSVPVNNIVDNLSWTKGKH